MEHLIGWLLIVGIMIGVIMELSKFSEVLIIVESNLELWLDFHNINKNRFLFFVKLPFDIILKRINCA